MYSSLALFLDFHPMLVPLCRCQTRTPIIHAPGAAREPASNDLTVFGTWRSHLTVFADSGEVVSLHIEQFRTARLQSEQEYHDFQKPESRSTPTCFEERRAPREQRVKCLWQQRPSLLFGYWDPSPLCFGGQTSVHPRWLRSLGDGARPSLNPTFPGDDDGRHHTNGTTDS